MRFIGVAVVAIALAAGLVAVRGGAGEGSRVASAAREIAGVLGLPAPEASAPPTRPAGDAAPSPPREQATAAAAPEPGPAAGAKRVYYQFTDASGTVRFVEELAQVPPAQRSHAGRIEIDNPPASPARAPRPRGPRPFAYTPPPPPPRVTVYTAPWCGWCRRTLAYLDQHRIPYENKDIEANPAHRRELIAKTGRSSIPVVEINGSRINGYSPRRMEELLAAARRPSGS